MDIHIRSQTKKHLTISGIFLLATVILTVGLHVYVDHVKDTITELNIDLVRASADDIAVLRRSVRYYDEYRPSLDEALISPEDTFTFLESIQVLAAENNLDEEVQVIQLYDVDAKGKRFDVSQGKQATNRKHGEFYIAMETAGTWDGTIRFIEILESLPYALSVESLALTATPEAGELVWRSQLVIITTTL